MLALRQQARVAIRTNWDLLSRTLLEGDARRAGVGKKVGRKSLTELLAHEMIML